jgi:hypothetical protein
MSFCKSWKWPDCLRASELWGPRALTLEALLRLLGARLAIAALPFGWWRQRLGALRVGFPTADPKSVRKYAAHVERAAQHLPLESSCLARAMALSWMLRQRRINHDLTFAVRAKGQRAEADALHAWISIAGETVLGDLPGPWHVVLRLPSNSSGQSDGIA